MGLAFPVPITALYSGVLALVLVALALRIVRLRWKTSVGIGDGGDRAMLRAIRVHGNATEYVPIALLLLLVAELNHGNSMLLHGCGSVLVMARVLHAVGLAHSAGASWQRIAGTVGTVGAIVTLAAVNIATIAR